MLVEDFLEDSKPEDKDIADFVQKWEVGKAELSIELQEGGIKTDKNLSELVSEIVLSL